MRLAVLAGLCLASATAMAAPNVTVALSGSSGNWTMDFSVENTLGVNNMDIYFFGVQLSARDITGSPTTWDPNTWTSWDNSGFGGSSTIYNNNWINFNNVNDLIQNGETVSGFVAHSTDTNAPTSIRWFAFAADFTGSGANYFGGDNFNSSSNPGFEGKIDVVPEPASMIALAVGGVALLRRRRK
ncbi:MAG: PEP-CTERM sorting domain-containing protein [Fimbriimonadaceae bacterium]